MAQMQQKSNVMTCQLKLTSGNVQDKGQNNTEYPNKVTSNAPKKKIPYF